MSSPADDGSPPVTGAVMQHLSPLDWRHRQSYFEGSSVVLLLDATDERADMYGGVNTLAPGAEISRHWHHVGEFQFILAGTGVALGPGDSATPIAPHSMVFSPAGPSGLHGFRNTGLVPLSILFVYPSAGGVPPEIILEDR